MPTQYSRPQFLSFRGRRYMTDQERFWAKIDPCRTDACYIWLADKDKYGYGNFSMKNDPAHLKSHQFLAGKCLPGFEWDHLCRTPACAYPEHLEAVTHAENLRRGMSPSAQNTRKTHCNHGHEFSEANTYLKNRTRDCRTCHMLAERERRARAH